MVLYQDSLVKNKSDDVSRSHGIFLIVRDRLINLDDALLPGMAPLAHGAFNKTRITVHADELDSHITSTRESIKDSPPYSDLKRYITSKFSELHSFWLSKKEADERSHDVSYKVSKASYALTRGPLFATAKMVIDGNAEPATLINVPEFDNHEASQAFINSIEEDLDSEDGIVQQFENEFVSPSLPICRLELATRTVYVNMLHPFIIYTMESTTDIHTIHLLAVTELLFEAHMIEAGLESNVRKSLTNKRDQTLRELASSDQENPATVAQMISECEANADGLEEAVVAAFRCLGFDTVRIGGPGKPDGIAEAHLGQSGTEETKYKVTLEAKSTKHDKASSGNIPVSVIDNHRKHFEADYAVVVAPGYQGVDLDSSQINEEADKHADHITFMTTTDLITLVSLSGPKQISLEDIRSFLVQCSRPSSSKTWIADLESRTVTPPPYSDIIDSAWQMQKSDSERPTVHSIRIGNEALKVHSVVQLRSWIKILVRQLPNYISIDGEEISLNTKPENIKKALQHSISEIPVKFRQFHTEAFGAKEQ